MSTKDKSILVVGCGIIGLTSALSLQELGYKVTIIARDLPPNTTSDVAAAFWYPYYASPVEKVLPWAAVTLERYYQDTKDPDSGVVISALLDLYAEPVAEPFWLPPVRHYQRRQAEQLPQGYQDGYLAEVPVIEASVYLQFLMKRFSDGGGEIVLQTSGIGHMDELAGSYPVVVNCTGLGAQTFCLDDTVFAIKGQVLKVGKPKLEHCLLDEHSVTYIVPRSADCVLGGTAEVGQWDVGTEPEVSADILARCSELLPELAALPILSVRAGLRPGRPTVRVELERRSADFAVVHNYGHGGAGFTVAWGCAADVVGLVNACMGF